MVERKWRGERERFQEEIVVCNARLLWSGPDKFPNADRLYVGTFREAFYASLGLADLAEWIVTREPLSKVPDAGRYVPKMNYKAPMPAALLCLDGYFDRPSVPVEFYAYSDLRPDQIEELEGYLQARLAGA